MDLLLNIGFAALPANPIFRVKIIYLYSLLAPPIRLEPIFLLLPPFISRMQTIALPHRMVIPVTPMPLNCPPKNRALIVNNAVQYRIPAIAQVMSFLLLIIRQAAFAPIIDVVSNMITIP